MMICEGRIDRWMNEYVLFFQNRMGHMDGQMSQLSMKSSQFYLTV